MAYSERDRFNDELQAIQAEVLLGRVPYGGYENALNFIYQNYGVPAGISYEEAQSAMKYAWGIPQDQAVLGETVENNDKISPTPTPTTGLTEAEKLAAYNTHLANLDQIRINRQKATDDSNAQYQGLLQNEQDLTTQRGKGYEQNSAYFSNVSPDAFQSQIINYNQKVLDAYNQGMNTVANNRENIRIAKENTLAGLASQEQGENSFNQATGYYDQPYTYTPINYQSPVLTPVTQSPYSQSAMFPGQAAQWSPNKVGAEDDPYKFLK